MFDVYKACTIIFVVQNTILVFGIIGFYIRWGDDEY